MPFNLIYETYPNSSKLNIYDGSLNIIKNTLSEVKSYIDSIIHTDVSANIIFYNTTMYADNFGVDNITPLNFNLNINLDRWPLVDGSYTNLGDISFNYTPTSYIIPEYNNILFTKLVRKTLVGLGTTESNFTGTTATNEYKKIAGGSTIPTTQSGGRYFLSRTKQVIGNCTYPGLPNELMYDNINESSGLTDNRRKIYLSNVFGGVLNDLDILQTAAKPSSSSFGDYFPDYPSELLDGTYSCNPVTISSDGYKLDDRNSVVLRYPGYKKIVLATKNSYGLDDTGRGKIRLTYKIKNNTYHYEIDLVKGSKKTANNGIILTSTLNTDKLKFQLSLPQKLSDYRNGELSIFINIKDSNRYTNYKWNGRDWDLTFYTIAGT